MNVFSGQNTRSKLCMYIWKNVQTRLGIVALGWGQCITHYKRNSLPTLADFLRFGIHSISHEVMFVQWTWVAQILAFACSNVSLLGSNLSLHASYCLVRNWTTLLSCKMFIFLETALLPKLIWIHHHNKTFIQEDSQQVEITGENTFSTLDTRFGIENPIWHCCFYPLLTYWFLE